MKEIKLNFDKLIADAKHAFSLEPSKDSLFEGEAEFLENLANSVKKRRLSAPALLFLETFKPLNYIGSQAMIFFRPFMTIIFPALKFDIMSKSLEKRESINKLISMLEKK